MMVWNYLSFYYHDAMVTLEVTTNDVRVHFCDFEMTPDEVKRTAEKTDNLRVAGTELTFNTNEQGGFDTFDIVWPYWRYDKC